MQSSSDLPHRRPLRVLCLDAEGGHGGSSRSLAASLRWIDRTLIEPTVWCRRGGAIEEYYRNLSIPCVVHPGMPKHGALRRLSRTLYTRALFLSEWKRSRPFLERFEQSLAEFDLVHFNIETLHDLAAWARRRTNLPMTMHVRTRPAETVFARRQARRAVNAINSFVYITENERERFETLAGTAPMGRVIYNIAEVVGDGAPEGKAPVGEGLKIAVLSNYDYMRGIDRCVDIAVELARRGLRDFKFVIAGDMKLSRSLPGELGVLGRSQGTLEDYARTRGVADMFEFLGHISDPERVLKACDLLIKPTREDNPWGRDIIEALGAGRPVMSCGSYNRFVETDVTGVLLSPYSSEAAAEHLIRLSNDRSILERMGAAGRRRIADLCSGPKQASLLADVWITAQDHRVRD